MKKAAFTLVELLVVIAIIAVLMAILMPSLRAARDHAKRIHCTNNLRTLSLAWYMYQDENDGKLVYGRPANNGWVKISAGSSPNPIEREKEGIRQGLLFPFVKDVDVYRCLADARKKIPGKETFGSYSIAGSANGEKWDASDTVQAKIYADIKRPTSKYIFVEECDPRGPNVGSWVMDFNPAKWVDPFAAWHNRKSGLGYADGHAEMHGWKDESTIEMSKLAANMDTRSIRYPIPANEGEDVDFMAGGNPCKSHD